MEGKGTGNRKGKSVEEEVIFARGNGSNVWNVGIYDVVVDV